jgi:hypothetical protein
MLFQDVHFIYIIFFHKVPRLIKYLGLGKCSPIQGKVVLKVFITDSVSELCVQKLYIFSCLCNSRGGPYSCEMSILSQFLDSLFADGSEVVSAFCPLAQENSCYSFLFRAGYQYTFIYFLQFITVWFHSCLQFALELYLPF